MTRVRINKSDFGQERFKSGTPASTPSVAHTSKRPLTRACVALLGKLLFRLCGSEAGQDQERMERQCCLARGNLCD